MIRFCSLTVYAREMETSASTATASRTLPSGAEFRPSSQASASITKATPPKTPAM
jgi:hypothetical protein